VIDPTRVLLVEDQPGDARLITEALAEASERGVAGRFEASVARTLAEGLELLAVDGFDAVLLDLQLPDSRGVDTFRRVRVEAPECPIVVLSGLEDDEVALTALREGAQDYLVKGRADAELLARSVRYAIERRRAEVERARRLHEEAARREAETALRVAREAEQQRRERQEREIASFERLAGPAAASVTARSYGGAPLRAAVPATFGTLGERYAALLDQALEQRAYRVDHRLSDQLRALANELGFLNAGPRDVVELHAGALRSRIEVATPQRAQAYVDEGRVLVLELMGYLVAYYRT
jgi:DNA-binding response OmpR family regulator